MLPAPCPCDVSQGLRTYEPFLRTNPGQRRQRGHELGARKLQVADWNVDHNRGITRKRAWKQVSLVLRIVRPQSYRSERLRERHEVGVMQVGFVVAFEKLLQVAGHIPVGVVAKDDAGDVDAVLHGRG